MKTLDTRELRGREILLLWERARGDEQEQEQEQEQEVGNLVFCELGLHAKFLSPSQPFSGGESMRPRKETRI